VNYFEWPLRAYGGSSGICLRPLLRLQGHGFALSMIPELQDQIRLAILCFTSPTPTRPLPQNVYLGIGRLPFHIRYPDRTCPPGSSSPDNNDQHTTTSCENMFWYQISG
jgi:hypothetical protein